MAVELDLTGGGKPVVRIVGGDGDTDCYVSVAKDVHGYQQVTLMRSVFVSADQWNIKQLTSALRCAKDLAGGKADAAGGM